MELSFMLHVHTWKGGCIYAISIGSGSQLKIDKLKNWFAKCQWKN